MRKYNKCFKKLLFSFVLFLSGFAEAKIYDCFCFYNEFELLKMRFEELWDCVDYFVVVESIETQKGSPKSLYFLENVDAFEKYKSKIIHVIVDEVHPEFSFWERENYQRNCIARGLKNCDLDDIIIISDVDEIPNKNLFPSILTELRDQCTPLRAVSLQQTIYFYQLNRQTPTGETWGGGHWVGTVFTTFRDLQTVTPQYFRDQRGRFPVLNNAGWHFTWMGGREKIRLKLRSVVEGNDQLSDASDAEVDLWISNHPVVPVNASFPEYIIKNQDYLISIGYLAPCTEFEFKYGPY